VLLLSISPSRTQRIIPEPKGLACLNLEGRFPTLDATRIPVSRSNGQRSGSPGPLMLTHIISSKCHGLQTYRIPLVPPSKYKPSLCSPQLLPEQCVEYYDMILTYLIAAQGTLLSQASVGLNITVTTR